MFESIKVLAHLVTGEGILPYPEKVEAVVKMRPPTTLKETRSFLGLCNYYRKAVANFSQIAAPLYQLAKKDQDPLER